MPTASTDLPTTTKGDIIVNNGSINTRLPVGVSNGQVLKVNSGASTGLEWGAASANLQVRNAVTTDSPSVSTDDYIYCSGASFTLTLPTAVGNTGKVFYFQHAGTSLTQVYTFNTTGGQTIGGIASGSYALYTATEELTIVSNGTNWDILNHFAETDWSATETTVYISSAVNPVTPGTATTNTIKWRRRGQYCLIQVMYKQTATATANSGTYGYRIQMPAGMQNINTAVTNTNTLASSVGQDIVTQAIVIGTAVGSSGGGTLGGVNCVAVYDTTTFRIVGSWGGTFGTLGGTLTFASGNNAAWFCTAEFPISGWQP